MMKESGLSCDLLPCPFCGHEATMKRYQTGLRDMRWRVYCSFCLIRKENYGDPDSAAKAWNQRSDRQGEKL